MKIRNVAIIAHVDHGKTTLVDRLLQQSGTFRENQRVAERAMDSNDLERERGITILAKAASVQWKDTRINIVDTPGHADFGGEVERILNMVDGALVLVDAAEGPLPQTKFVVSKALKVGLKPIVVINKVDRPDARPTEVINEVFDLFAALDASDEQLDFPILYGSAKQGWMAESPDGPKDKGMQPLFDLIVRHVAPPKVEQGSFRMIGTILEANPYLGRIITGRITSGVIKPNQQVKVLSADGKVIEQGRLTKILAFRGIERAPIEEVVIDVDEEHSGVVVQKMSERKAEMIEMRPSGGHRLRLVFYAPTRGLIGYQGELLTDTRGTAIMNRLFHGYAPYKGEIQGRRNGVLISNDQGEAVAYAMFKLEDRGPMMIEPGWKVYKGMIVGEHTRDNDLEINVLKGKQLTNIRTTAKDEAVRLTPPIKMTLEKALAYIEVDELVEVTPKSIRLRKKFLDANDRKRAEKARQAVA